MKSTGLQPSRIVSGVSSSQEDSRIVKTGGCVVELHVKHVEVAGSNPVGSIMGGRSSEVEREKRFTQFCRPFLGSWNPNPVGGVPFAGTVANPGRSSRLEPGTAELQLGSSP